MLAVGSHFDDVWLGCSATLMLLRDSFDAQVVVTDLCDHYSHNYFGRFPVPSDLGAKVDELCAEFGFRRHVVKLDTKPGPLPDREFPRHRDQLERRIERLYEDYGDADLVFIPRRDDYHQDHVVTAQEVLKLFRRSTIFEYEIKEFRRGAFQPTVLVDVSGKSQRDVSWGKEILGVCRETSFAEQKAKMLGIVFSDFLATSCGELPGTFSKDYVLGKMAMRAEEFGLDGVFAEGFVVDQVIR